MNTRADLAIIKESMLILVEIKSDKDTLARLENQLIDYDKYATNIYLVLDWNKKEKFEQFREANPHLYRIHLELFFYKNNKIVYSNGIEVKKIDSYLIRVWRKRLEVINFLWRKERKQFIHFIKGRSKVNLDEAIFNIYTFAELFNISTRILHDRVSKNKGKRFKDNGAVCGEIGEIKNKECKQKAFNEWIEN